MSITFDNIQFWDTQAKGFTYPEMQAAPVGYAPIQNRANAGICVSGGGSVSASLIAGYYAALSELKIMANLRYVSGVSGGTWGTAPYVYGGGPNFSGTLALPADIQLSDIQKTDSGTMQDAVANADIADTCITYLTEAEADGAPTNRVYEKGVGACFLDPLGIKSPSYLDLDPQFFSSTSDMVKNISDRNKKIKNGFMTLADDMPFPIMNTTMFVPVTQPNMDPTNYICPFEVTPLYCGIKAPQTITNCNQNIGGFFIESFGFNTTLDSVNNGVAQATGTYPFELCQPVGASGAALESMLETSLPQLLGCFPQFMYWNPYQSPVQSVQYDFGDGGCIEDTGITSLLARGVTNIGAFLTEPVFFPAVDAPGRSGFTERVFGYNQIACLFGAPLIDTASSATNGVVEYITPPSSTRQVFNNTNNEFEDLLTAMSNARTGGNGIVVPSTLSVVPNALFGITTGYTVDVIWSVIDNATVWESALPSISSNNVSGFMADTANNLTDFPEILVFMQNPKNVIELTAPQTNLLADFGYWMVMNNQDTITPVLAPVEG